MTDELRAETILVVDDQPANVILLERLLGRWGYQSVVTTTHPRDVVALCEQHEPDIVLLDLAMPELDGFAVLAALKPWREADVPLPVIVLTADITVESKRRALASGARDFLTKPFDHDEVRLRVGNLLETRRLQLAARQYNELLEQRVRERTLELELARLEVVERLALAGEYRDGDTQQHARRIGELSTRIAIALGVDDRVVTQLQLAAMLHDIGKLAIPDAVLLKAGPLTEDEREIVKGHALAGAGILGGSTSELLRLAEEVARTHHERWDGGGYPAGLLGAEIPLAARIVAVADVFDALTHARPYKEAWPVEWAITEIVANSGSQFDPAVVTAFLTVVETMPPPAPQWTDRLAAHAF